MEELLATAARAALVYVLLLLIVRLLGKRTIGNLTAFDLIVALILSELVDGPIFGEVPLTQALAALLTLAALHYLNARLSSRSEWLDRLTGGSPAVLIRDGKVDERALSAEHMNRGELLSLLRQQGVDSLEDVRLGTLEPEGKLSVLLTAEAETLRRRDLGRLVGK